MTFRFYPGEYRIRPVSAAWELRACAALRRDVFCEEQKLFAADDADTLDRDALHIAAIACVLSQPEQVVGTVRIHKIKSHEADGGIWFGSRLAVHNDFRCGHALGHKLIRHAVCTAHAQGAREFFAHVQLQNAPLFRRLHWRALETLDIYGQPHVLMAADLDFYPPAVRDEITLYTPSRTIKSQTLTAWEAA